MYFKDLPSYSDVLSEANEDQSFSNLYKYCFETSSTSLGDVTSSNGLVVLATLVFLIRQIKSVAIPSFRDVGRRMGRTTHGVEWEKENQERITKFGEYVFRLLFHSALSIFGLWYFCDKPWWDLGNGGQRTIFSGYPHHEIETGMIWYYLIQSAYNVDAMISLIELSFVITVQFPICPKRKELRNPVSIAWSPTCRGDFREMFIHHVVTNMLVLGSSFCRFTRVGSMLLLLHDISDVPVDLSKLANFMKWKITTIVCFISILVMWSITRLGILPFVIWKTIYLEGKIVYMEGPIDRRLHDMYVRGFAVLIACLIGLHLFWFSILIRMGYRLVTKGERHDLTEHKNGEDQSLISSEKAS
jgi:ceramide synthetase